MVPFDGVTTVVAAGDAGANNIANLRRFIAAQSRARMFTSVYIANVGLAAFLGAELYSVDRGGRKTNLKAASCLPWAAIQQG